MVASIFASQQPGMSIPPGRGKMLLLASDSIGRGWGDGFATGPGSGTLPQAGTTNRVNSWPAKAAALLAADGVPNRYDAFAGSANISNGGVTTPADIAAAYDNGSVIESDWVITQGAQTIGGRCISSAGTTNDYIFTPMIAANQFDILYIAQRPATVSDPSGLLDTIPTSAFSPQKRTVNRAVASTDPIRIRAAAGSNNFFLAMVIARNTADNRLQIINGGAGGSQTSTWTTAPGGNLGYRSMLPVLLPSHVLVMLGANDANGGVAAATYQANLTTICQAAADISAKILLAKCNKSRNQSGTGFDIPAGYLSAIDTVAATFNAPVIDFNTPSASWTQADYFDVTGPHPSSAGTTKMADISRAALRALF